VAEFEAVLDLMFARPLKDRTFEGSFVPVALFQCRHPSAWFACSLHVTLGSSVISFEVVLSL
jgi:hypothetical protein